MPGAAERLTAAAMDLYAERGFEQTTVADIADRAGVTSRTFFRHFADKREVLFRGWPELQAAMTAAAASAAPNTPAREIATAVLDITAQIIGANVANARRRQAVIAATPELQERELRKFAVLAEDLARNLRARGIDEIEAELAAHTSLAVYRVAFEQWIRPGAPERSLTEVVTEVSERLQRLSAQ